MFSDFNKVSKGYTIEYLISVICGDFDLYNIIRNLAIHEIDFMKRMPIAVCSSRSYYVNAPHTSAHKLFLFRSHNSALASKLVSLLSVLCLHWKIYQELRPFFAIKNN